MSLRFYAPSTNLGGGGEKPEKVEDAVPRASVGCLGVAILFVVVCVTMITQCALAQDAVSLRYQGQSGVWLPLQDARDALSARKERPNLEARIHLLDQSLSLARIQIERYGQALRLSTEEQQTLRAVIESAQSARILAEKGKAEAEADRDSWWRSPLLWFSTGVALTVAALVTVFFLAT